MLRTESSEDNDQAELYYLDYGDTDIVNCKEICELQTNFLKLHFQAIECGLARVEPISGVWTEEAIDKFEEWTHVAQWKKLSARLHGCTKRDRIRAKREGSPVPCVDLFDVTNDRDIDIAQEMVKQGFAVYKKEDLKSSRTTSQNSVDSLSN